LYHLTNTYIPTITLLIIVEITLFFEVPHVDQVLISQIPLWSKKLDRFKKNLILLPSKFTDILFTLLATLVSNTNLVVKFGLLFWNTVSVVQNGRIYLSNNWLTTTFIISYFVCGPSVACDSYWIVWKTFKVRKRSSFFGSSLIWLMKLTSSGHWFFSDHHARHVHALSKRDSVTATNSLP